MTLGGSMDSNMVKEKILGLMGVLWVGEEDINQSPKRGQEATVLRWWVLHESLLVG